MSALTLLDHLNDLIEITKGIKYKALSLPPIAGLECMHTNEEYIYVTCCTVYTLKVYQYSITNNKWRELCDVPDLHSFIATAMDETNNKLYIVGKHGARYASSIHTKLCSLDINTMKYNLKTIYKQYNVINFDDMLNLLICIPSPINELHLLYSSSIRHIIFNINNNSLQRSYTEHIGINTEKYLKFAKCVYMKAMQRIFVFGGKAPKLQIKRDQNIMMKDNNKNKDKLYCNEIEIKSNSGYYSKKAVAKSIWFCDIKKGYKWNLYKQRLPKTTRNFGVLNAFNFLIFLFYKSIWCLDLWSGDIVKSNKLFPLNCFEKMQMVSTNDNYAHFMLINKNCAMVEDNNIDSNKLSKEILWNEHDNDIGPLKKCNFHICVDLLDVIPSVIKHRHKQRYLLMIQNYVTQFVDNFASELIHLIAMYTAKLCH